MDEALFVWQRGKLIGRGRFGKVYAGIHLPSAMMMAVKQMRIQGSGFNDIEGTFVAVEEESIENIEQEIRIGLTLHHPHVVEYYGAEQDGNIYSIFMEYLPLGSVSGLLKSVGPLDESIICAYTAQLLQGLRYLHSRGISHRDIKCANLLLCDNGCIKIADFGAAKHPSHESIDHITRSAQDGIGSSFWMSPEIIRADCIGSDGWTKSDIWSAGCCVIEMATGKPPWSNFSNPLTAMFHIASETTIPTIPECLSSSAQEFLTSCFIKDPSMRPTAQELLKHPFFMSLPRYREQYTWYKHNTKPLDGGRWWFDGIEWVYWIPVVGGYWCSSESKYTWTWVPEDTLSMPLEWIVAELVYIWLTQARLNLSVVNLPTDLPDAASHFEERKMVRVVADYDAADETELSIHINDILEVHEMDENGWWHGSICYSENPATGWFPCTYVEWIREKSKIMGVVRSLGSFECSDPSTELSFADQDLVLVLDTPEDGWWHGKKLLTLETGWFPSTYVEWIPTASVMWPYNAYHSNELSLVAGDMIAILQNTEDMMWCEGVNLSQGGSHGWFPRDHVKDDEEETKSQSSDASEVVEYDQMMEI